MTVHAAAAVFDIHLPESRSLKAKRAHIRPVIEGLRGRFRASVAEVDHQDQWQRASIGVAVIATSERGVLEQLQAAERFVVSRPDVEIIDISISWLDHEVFA
ncbi:MAG TPA: DUF503 domain-containing protein [Acidimicrobiia bacterium]|jgi:hypothetical protein